MAADSPGLRRPVKSFKLPQAPYDVGLMLERSNTLSPRENTDDTISGALSGSVGTGMTQPLSSGPEVKSVTLGSLPTAKRKIWKPSLSSSKLTTLSTRASRIWDRALTSKGKGFCDYWTAQSEEISKRLWLPTKTDCAGLDSSLSNESYSRTVGKSWFCITRNCHQNKSSSKIFSQSLQSSVPDSTVCEVTHSKEKLGVQVKRKKPNKTGKAYKTITVRLFPTPSEEQELLDESAQHRWYYNAYLDIFDLDAHMKTVNDAKAAEEDFAPSVNWQTLQERLKDYEYVEEIGTRMKVCSLRVREGAAEARQDKDAKVTLEKERKKQIAKDKKCKEKAEQELIESVMSKEQVKEHRARLRDERATLRAAAKEQKSRERAERKAAEQNMTKQQIKKYRSELRAAKLAASGKTAPIPKPRNMAKYPMPDWMEDKKVYERVKRTRDSNCVMPLIRMFRAELTSLSKHDLQLGHLYSSELPMS